MTYEYNKPVPAEALCGLRAAVGWNRMEKEYGDPRMRSYYHIAAYDGGVLAGYADCVSNGVTDAYIQDLMVRPDHQGMGIGTALMERMIAHLKEDGIYMISVIFDEELKPFYEKFGFNTMLSGQLETYRA